MTTVRVELDIDLDGTDNCALEYGDVNTDGTMN